MNAINTLTGLRGVAALWVCLLHYNYGQTGSLGLKLIAHGDWGVIIFFILSGFIMAYVYQDWFSEPNDWRRFLLLRFARVYPLHLITLLVMVVAIWANLIKQEENDTLFTFVLNIFLLHGWGFVEKISWNDPSWSISIEAFCYLIFPLLLIKIRAANPLVVLIGLLAVVLLNPYGSLIREIFGRPVVQFGYGVSLFTWTVVFAIGVALYQLVIEFKRFGDVMVCTGIALIISGALCLEFPSNPSMLAFLVVASSFLIAGLYQEGPLGKFIFANSVTVFLGDISYALYLTHIIVLDIFNGIFLQTGVEMWWAKLPSVVQLVIAISVAASLHYGFEKPIRRGLRRFFAQLNGSKLSTQQKLS